MILKRILLALFIARVSASLQAAKPNVLLIAMDDLNDWVGALGGHHQARTPILDQLAKRGVLFTRAYCTAPSCNPSRASLMTGILPSTSGVYHNSQPWRPAMPKAVTLPQHFTEHGYWSAGSGKSIMGVFLIPPPGRPIFLTRKRINPMTRFLPSARLMAFPKRRILTGDR